MRLKDKPFFYGATNQIFERAKELRSHETEAEKILWGELKMNKLGVRFYRQHPINKFIVDFYCHSKLLVVELDGEIHNRVEVLERDEGREDIIKNFGIRVIRFSNTDVFRDLESVVKGIKSNII